MMDWLDLLAVQGTLKSLLQHLSSKAPQFNDQSRQHIKKQRHYFANKGPSGQGYGFSSGHVWMGELDYKEG